jgi:hypothetical protein
MTAAIAAAPVIPRGLAAAAAPGSSPSSPGAVDGRDAALNAAAARIVLHEGSQGELVAAAQRRLNEVLPLTHVAVDGVFGSQTQGAVKEVQRREAMSSTGVIDARTWSVLFKAPVLVLGGPATAGANGNGSSGSVPASDAVATPATPGRAQAAQATPSPSGAAPSMRSRQAPTAVHVGGGGAVPGGSSDAPASGSPNAGASSNAGGPASSGSTGSSAGTNGSGAPPVAVVAPTTPTSQSSTYVLTNGVALPLPRQYLSNGSVDQGVDYAAPGGTPLYAMGDGVIIGEGISGFGPNAPILKITSGPLKGVEIYYGHAGSNLVHTGAHVHAGQQISVIGYGIVGISTGPHLEVGFYPPGANGAGSRMLSLINSMLRQHPSGRAWGATGTTLANTTRATAAVVHGKRKRAHARRGASVTNAATGGSAAATSPPATAAASPPATAATAPPPTTASPAPPAVASPPAAPAGNGSEGGSAVPTADSAPSAPAAASTPSTPAADTTPSAPAADSAPSTPGGGSTSTPAGSPGATTATTATTAGDQSQGAIAPQPPAAQQPAAQAPAAQAPNESSSSQGVGDSQTQAAGATGPAATSNATSGANKDTTTDTQLASAEATGTASGPSATGTAPSPTGAAPVSAR